MQATVTGKGQITLPKSLRDRLDLVPVDRVEFIVDEGNGVRLIPRTTSIKRLRGLLPRPEQPISLDEMEEAIARGASGEGQP